MVGPIGLYTGTLATIYKLFAISKAVPGGGWVGGGGAAAAR